MDEVERLLGKAQLRDASSISKRKFGGTLTDKSEQSN